MTRLPHGLLSLADMINYRLLEFTHVMWSLMVNEGHYALKAQTEIVSGDDIAGHALLLDWLEQHAVILDLKAATHRIEKFRQSLEPPTTYASMVYQTKALREAIEGDSKEVFFYHYPPSKAVLLDNVEQDWKVVLEKFKSARPDILGAVDCWAMGHATASVFHSMRVAERGLRVLARERRVRLPKDRPIEYAEWRTIIDGTEKKAVEIGNKPPGPKRDAALEFYRGVLGELHALKDEYRNPVMHARSAYDEHRALSVMLHVKGLMGRLAAKLDEDGKRQIAWGFR